MDFFHQLEEHFGGRAREYEPLAKHVNFRIGGRARYFVEVSTIEDMTHAVRLATAEHVPFVVLGGGSNVLVADAGYDGLVMKTSNRKVNIDDTRVMAEAGAMSALVARMSAEAGLRGFEWAISLPGTIGGAVRGNAGCFGGEMQNVVESVRILRAGELRTLLREECRFAYRHSIFKEPEGAADVILDVTLHLRKGGSAEAMAQLEKHLAARKALQPLGTSSAGCMFQNVEYADEAEIARLFTQFVVPDEMRAKKRIAAGWIIDQLGLKGTRVGDAEVSHMHGNFLVNRGHATADDVMQLLSLVKTRVRNAVGVQLREEVRLLGF